MRSLLRSKIHLATVTEANLDYVGSITIDRDLMDAVGLWPGEKVLVSSHTSGARLETYVIEAPPAARAPSASTEPPPTLSKRAKKSSSWASNY